MERFLFCFVKKDKVECVGKGEDVKGLAFEVNMIKTSVQNLKELLRIF